MDDIAKHLSMSKKTIYQFYKEKDEIVHQLFLYEIDEDKKNFENIFLSAENIVDEAFKIIKLMHQMIGQCNPIMFHELIKFYPQTWKVFHDFKSDFMQGKIEVALAKGQKEGLVRDDIDIKLLSKIRVSLVDMAFNSEIFPADKYKVLDVHIALTEHFLYGVCTLKGHKLINKYKNIDED
jgi:TetR/AcrR family transcriptional regulator, cholesterol catabolism regulator